LHLLQERAIGEAACALSGVDVNTARAKKERKRTGFEASSEFGLVGKKTRDFVIAQMLASFEIREFDQEGIAFDLRAEPFEQLAGRIGSTAGCKQIVNDQHAMAVADGVVVNLERKPSLSLKSGVISLKRIPGMGKSGIARISVSTSTAPTLSWNAAFRLFV